MASRWLLACVAAACVLSESVVAQTDVPEGPAVFYEIEEPTIRPIAWLGKHAPAECEKPETKSTTDRLPVFVETPRPEDEKPKERYLFDFEVDYDNGFVLRPIDKKKNPYELKINSWIQFRHVGFTRDAETYTDNAGNTRIIRNRNYFDIERGRLVFSGFALTPKLNYYLQLDGDTDGQDDVDFFDYYLTYRFADWLSIDFGKRKVPGTRQWMLSPRHSRLVDRPLSDEFFRPDRTVGVFAVGDLGEHFHYELMVANGYSTSNLNLVSSLNNRMAYAGTFYWDPFGDFGRQIVDYNRSEKLLARIGHSAIYCSQSGVDNSGLALAESNYVRLTDGTLLTTRGALAPGVIVSDFDVCMYVVDVAAKWRGWSANAEFYFRWIDGISGSGRLPLTSLYQNGFYFEGGYFVIPKKLDVNLRYSQIDGLFGEHSEYAGGFNWYPLDNNKLKVSFDVISLDGSPVNNTASEVLAGDDGVLFRTQVQAEF